MSKGRFITFEGMDGVGKTTQVARFVDWWKDQGAQVISLREPGGTALCENIRTLIKQRDPEEPMCPETEALLINAARAQLIRQVIQPALDSGVNVVCDRFADSTIAYQCFGRGLPEAVVAEVIQFATSGLQPDCTIYLELPREVRLSRIKDRENRVGVVASDRFEVEDSAFFDKVESGFRSISKSDPERFRVVSGIGNANDVFERILQQIRIHTGI